MKNNHQNYNFCYYTIAFILLLCCTSLQAQKTSQKFTHFGKQDGLNQSSVNNIYQDSDNYLWIANFGGINRFDGYNFMSYSNNFDDPNSIADNSVWYIYERKDKSLWFGTKSGLSKYNRESNNFSNYVIGNNQQTVGTLSVKAIFEDCHDRFYIGTEGEGLYIFDTDSESFSRVNSIPITAKISSISEDKNYNLWVATENLGLFKINAKRTNVQSLIKTNQIPSETIWSVLCDNNGNTWIGTDSDGLIRYNSTGITIFKNDKRHFNYASGNKIKTIALDEKGLIWVGSATDGLSYFSDSEGLFYNYKNNPYNSNSLFDNDVSSIFPGNNGELYVGLYTKGFDRLTRTPFNTINTNLKETNTLSNNNVYSIYKDTDGILWFGTFGGGLNRYDPKTKRFKHYRYDESNPLGISHDWIRVIYEDKNNTLWIGTWGGGLNKFDKTTEIFTQYLPNSKTKNSLSHNIVTAIFEDNDGELWVGTYGGGINIYQPKTDDFRSVVHDKNNANSISDDHITSFYQGENNLIWICTYGGGLTSFDKQTNTYRRYLPDPNKEFSLNNHKVLHIIKEADSSFYWLTTLGGGINKFYYNKDKFLHYTEKDGLSNNSTMGMLKDQSNNYWISTNSGISRFNPKNESFQNYTSFDGLASDDYNLEAYAKTADGTLYFGGKNGITYFNPAEVDTTLTFPEVKIMQVKVDDSLYASKLNKIKIPYNSRVSFDYAVINAPNVNNIKYAYRLVGQDKNWRTMNNIRHLEFTNLNPGKYELRLKSTSSNNDVWSEDFTSFKFNVPTPWYLSWYFRIGLVLIVLISAFLYYKRKLDKAHKQNIILEETVKSRTKVITEKNAALAEEKEKTLQANEKLKELNYLKDRILSIVSHDIKSPLNNLESLLDIFEDADEDITQENMSEYTGLIQKELNKVQALLNNLLMWAKYQVTSVKATKAEVKLHDVVDELYGLFESKTNKKHLRLVNTIEPEAKIKSDRNIIAFLLRNLIFNAIKFTPVNGEIKVVHKVENKMNYISVIDSGVGMTKEQADSIFSSDTISWKEGTSGERGTGLGLILCKDLAEELKGSISVSSELGKGSAFTFAFPV